MADPTDQNNDQQNTNPGSDADKNQSSTPDIDALVAQRVEEALKPIKENLDKAVYDPFNTVVNVGSGNVAKEFAQERV